MTHKFPVFNSCDDIEALMEIAAMFGRGAMEKCAMLHSESHHPDFGLS
jgi:cell division control protein 7